jgi:hypothetical protein
MRINIKFNYQRINAAQNGADTSAKFRRNDGKTNLSARHDLESRSVPAFFSKNPNQNPRSQTQQDRPLVAFVGTRQTGLSSPGEELIAAAPDFWTAG